MVNTKFLVMWHATENKMVAFIVPGSEAQPHIAGVGVSWRSWISISSFNGVKQRVKSKCIGMHNGMGQIQIECSRLLGMGVPLYILSCKLPPFRQNHCEKE
jgi:hypothetical protein